MTLLSIDKLDRMDTRSASMAICLHFIYAKM